MAIKFFGDRDQGKAVMTCLSSDTKPGIPFASYIGVCIETDTNKLYKWNDEWIEIPTGGSSAWGNITGTLANQIDLQSAFNGKSDAGHNHDGTYSTLAHNHDADYADLVHSHASTDISDSTATGRSVVTATDAAGARTAIGAGISNFDGVYSSLT